MPESGWGGEGGGEGRGCDDRFTTKWQPFSVRLFLCLFVCLFVFFSSFSAFKYAQFHNATRTLDFALKNLGRVCKEKGCFNTQKQSKFLQSR